MARPRRGFFIIAKRSMWTILCANVHGSHVRKGLRQNVVHAALEVSQLCISAMRKIMSNEHRGVARNISRMFTMTRGRDQIKRQINRRINVIGAWEGQWSPGRQILPNPFCCGNSTWVLGPYSIYMLFRRRGKVNVPIVLTPADQDMCPNMAEYTGALDVRTITDVAPSVPTHESLWALHDSLVNDVSHELPVQRFQCHFAKSFCISEAVPCVAGWHQELRDSSIRHVSWRGIDGRSMDTVDTRNSFARSMHNMIVGSLCIFAYPRYFSSSRK